MEADEDRSDRVDGLDRRGPRPDPGPARFGVGRLTEEVRFVAQAPCPDGRVIPQLAAHGAKEEILGLDRERGRVHVVDGVGLAAGHGQADELAIAGPRRSTAVDQPRGRPVRTAHMAREERHLDLKTRLGRDVTDRSEIAERANADPVRGRLEAFPQEEDADVGEAEIADHRELLAHLARVEVRPPGHRLAPRPVVDAQQEGLPEDAGHGRSAGCIREACTTWNARAVFALHRDRSG